MNDNDRYEAEASTMVAESTRPASEPRHWQLLGFPSWDPYMCWLDYTNADPERLPNA